MEQPIDGVVASVLPKANPQPGDIGDTRGVSQTPRRRGADYYHTILWRLLPASDGDTQGGFAVGMTSCGQRCGVSTVVTQQKNYVPPWFQRWL